MWDDPVTRYYVIGAAMCSDEWQVYDLRFPHFYQGCKLPDEDGTFRRLRFSSYTDVALWLDRMQRSERDTQQQWQDMLDLVATSR